jgi:outer membrane protein TolC
VLNILLILGIIFLFTILTGTSGCKTAPQRHPMDAGAPIPAQWSGVRQPTQGHRVGTFGNPRRTVLIQDAQAGNDGLKVAAAQVNAALAQVHMGGTNLWPGCSLHRILNKPRLADNLLSFLLPWYDRNSNATGQLRRTVNAQSAHLSVKRQLFHNRINLYLALGGNI